MAELARGSVVDRPWGRTLATIGLRAMSGQLTVYSDQREFAVVFSQGAVVGAYSPLPADSVARVALTAGLLTAHEVTEVARRKSHDDGTDVIAEVGRLTPDQVARLRRRATAHRAARTFGLERGDFVFTDTVTAGWHPDAAVDVRAVLYLGARLTLSEHRLASDLGLLGASFRLREDAIADLPQFGLSEAERPIVAALRQGAGLHAVEQACPDLDHRTVRAVIYALVCGGAVDAIGELPGQVTTSATPGPPVRPSSQVIPRTRTGNTSYPVTSAPPATAAPASTSIRPPSAPPPVHGATARTGSSRSRPPAEPVAARTATPMPAARPPAGRTVTPPDPPRTTTPPPPRRTAAPAAPRGRISSPGILYKGADVRVPTATGGAPPRNPLAVSEIQSLIKAKVSLVDQGADHYLLLGVTPDAPIEVIRGAFYGLVRRIHPDLLVAVGMTVTDDAQRLMARLNEAYAVLNAPDKRAEYESSLHGIDGAAAESLVTAALTAEERFRRGQAALKRDDLEEAVREFEAALELKKDEGDYLALLAWTRFCAASDKAAVAASSRQSLERASRMAPESVTPRFWLGRLERVLGRSPQALAHFRWVLDQDPRHAEAGAEVRVLMSRESRGPRARR
ncbi:MAG: DnaJ domain-containing protein [Kofleriaceae bacterium]